MAIPITVPRLGWNMEEGTFGGWLKADGDAVRRRPQTNLLERVVDLPTWVEHESELAWCHKAHTLPHARGYSTVPRTRSS